MKRFSPAIEALTSSSVLFSLIGWAAWATVTDLWPASRWLEVNSVVVVNGKAGEPLAMEVDRKVKDSFTATWTASVRSIDGHVVCSGSATSNYRLGATLPPDTTLSWWTNGGCTSLPSGRYYLATDWRIHAHGIWPEKVVSIDSPMFEVSP